MTTMKQIAERTGVSVSTVSLVMNHRDAGRVKADVAERVRRTARELGYRPNPLARSLRTSRTRIIGFLSGEVATTPYAGGIIRGAQDAAGRFGYVMLSVSVDVESDGGGGGIEALERYGVDGFLCAMMSDRVVSLPERLRDGHVVLADAIDAEGRVPGIRPDEVAIAYDATERLIRAGCRRIAYVGCAEPMLARDRRREGYRLALEAHGMAYRESLTADVWYNRSALEAVDALFERERPDGFFCFNDARAWYVYECAARRGLAVGRDVSVVGVDNHRVIAETFSPQLTTVELPHYEMGYWAMCRLVSMIEGRSLDGEPMPETTAQLPPFDGSTDTAIRCTLIDKESVAG